MRNRAAAIVGAIALIVVAVIARGFIAGDDDAGGSGGSDGGARPVVACSPGVQAVCTALADAGLVAEDTPTFDIGSDGATTGAVGEGPEVDAWITWDPAGAIANFDAQAATGSTTWDEPVGIGSSPLVVASHRELPSGCTGSGPVDWSCVEEGDSTVALGDPATIDGVVRALPLAAAFEPDRYFRDSVGLDHLRALYQRRTSARGPVSTETRTTQPGFYDAIVTTEVLADERNMTRVVPSGGFAVDLVVVPRSGASTDWVDGAFADPDVEAAVRAAGAEPGATTLATTDESAELYALLQEIRTS